MLDFSNALSKIDPQTIGLLGLRLMQAGQTNKPVDYAGMLSPLFQSRFQQNLNKTQTPPQTGTQNLQSLTVPTESMPEIKAPAGMNTGGGYIESLRQAAAATYPDNQIMQQVAITQAIQESGVNPSKLATQSNNYFGIKSPKGVSMPTQEYVNGIPQTETATFAINPTMQDSFEQHRRLMSNDRYKGVEEAQDPNAAFNKIAAAGYATDPRYAQKLASVYSQYVQPLYRG